MKKMDIVYPLGIDSKWEDNELRYSLRSVQMHFRGVGQIIIVGEKPAWLTNVIHIPHADEHREKETRIALKVLRACCDDRVSESFLFMNDDIFITAPDHIAYYPSYFSGTLKEAWERKTINVIYRNAIKNTMDKFVDKKYMLKYFDIHTPIVYNKYKFKTIFNNTNWTKEFSYVIKSLYSNDSETTGKLLKDCKVDHVLPTIDIKAAIDNRPCFSVGDRGLTDAMKKIIMDLYPRKSKYEI